MSTTPEREKFEAWVVNVRFEGVEGSASMILKDGDTYIYMQGEWEAWQAATAAARQSAPESCAKVDDCAESLCMQANRCKHTLPPQPQRLCVEQSASEAERPGVVIDAYAIPVEDYRTEIKIQRMRQIEGPALWKVARNGDCLNKSGEWEYEPMPSSRDDEFLARCRFDTAEEAIAAAMKA